MDKTDKILKALANSRRAAIVRFLNERLKVSVTTIAKHIDLSIKSTSKHMRILAGADIVTSEQVSLNILYSLNLPPHKITQAVLDIAHSRE